MKAVIRKKYHDGVICISTFFQRIQNEPQAMVHKSYRRKVGLDRMLPLPRFRNPLVRRGNMLQTGQINRILAQVTGIALLHHW